METSDGVTMPIATQSQGVKIGPAIAMALLVSTCIGVETSSPYYALAAGALIFTMVVISLQLEKIIYLRMKKQG